MWTLGYSGQFKKDLKKITKQGLNLDELRKVLNQLKENGQVEEKYLPHKLTGNWKGFWDCHIGPDWILLYDIQDVIKLVRITRTGSHSELFGKKKQKR